MAELPTNSDTASDPGPYGTGYVSSDANSIPSSRGGRYATRDIPKTKSPAPSGGSFTSEGSDLVSMISGTSSHLSGGHRGAMSMTTASVSSFPPIDRPIGEEPTLFKEKPSRKLYCMLCQKVYKDPVITTCGHTFCRKCIGRGNVRCPVDDCVLKQVIVPITVVEQIGELLIHCKYGTRAVQDKPGEYEVNPEGCPEFIKLVERRHHELNCGFMLVRCPNSDLCPRLQKKDLDEHLKSCDHMRCPHYRFNCPFHGTRTEVETHIQSCQYEVLRPVLVEVDERISKLHRLVKQKDDEISFLRSNVASVTERLNTLEKNYEFKTERLEEENRRLATQMTEVVTHLRFIQHEMQKVSGSDPHGFQCAGACVGHEGPVWSLCPYNDYLLSGSSDNMIKVWGPMTKSWDTQPSCIQTLPGHTGIVLALTTWNDVLYSGSADHTIRVWHYRSSAFHHHSTIHAHDNPVCTLAAANNYLFSGSLKTIKVWNTSNMEMVSEMASQSHWVRALLATEKYLYAGSYEALKVFNIDTLELDRTLEFVGGSVYSLALTPMHLVCGTYESYIYIWDPNNLDKTPTRLTGHSGAVHTLCVISVDSRFKLFSGGHDKSVKVWNLDTFKNVQTHTKHTGSVSSLVTIHGRLFSGGTDKEIKVWS